MAEEEFVIRMPGAPSPSEPPAELQKTREDVLNRLTNQQLRFCMEMVRCPQPKKAALNAGYAPKSAAQSAYNLLHSERYAYVQEALRLLQAEADRRSYDDKRAVIRDILEVYEQARMDGDLKSQIKLLDIRARILGMYSGSVECGSVPRKTEVTLRFVPPSSQSDPQASLF